MYETRRCGSIVHNSSTELGEPGQIQRSRKVNCTVVRINPSCICVSATLKLLLLNTIIYASSVNRLYITVDEPDLAITMYKKLKMYNDMIRTC